MLITKIYRIYFSYSIKIKSNAAVFCADLGSAPSHNGLFGADFCAAPAVQTAVLVNAHRLLLDVDALLRANGIAQFAADAAVPHKITGR